MATHDPQRHVQDHPQPGDSFDKEIGQRGIVGFGVALVVLCIITGALVVYLFKVFEKSEMAKDPVASELVQEAGRQVPPEPRLQVTPEQELQAFLAEQNTHLDSFGWVEEHAVAHIPIEKSMEYLLHTRKGIRTRQNPKSWQHPNAWQDPSLLSASEVNR